MNCPPILTGGEPQRFGLLDAAGSVVGRAFGEVAGDVVFDEEESADTDADADAEVKLKFPLGDVRLAEALAV